jgi:hypothetical protein
MLQNGHSWYVSFHYVGLGYGGTGANKITYNHSDITASTKPAILYTIHCKTLIVNGE